MVFMSLILYGWLLSGKYGNLQLMLLVGIIIGTLNSVSTFMRKLLAPSEFDILQARLFGSVNHADPAYFPIVIPMIIIVAVLIFAHSKNLNVLSLGKDVATSFGVKYQPSVIYTLVLVAILMSISTALIGPLTFYGFLVATLSYRRHQRMIIDIFSDGFCNRIFNNDECILLMYHVFHAQGVVSVIIELFGGIIFLTIVLRKRAL